MPQLEAAPAPVAEPAAAPAPAPETLAVPARKTFDDVKAARREAAAPAEAAPVAPTPATPVAAKAEIDMTPEELVAATARSKTEREERAKLKELEAKAASGTKLEEASALLAKGQHLAAAELLGIDLEAAVAERLGTKPEDDEDPKVKDLRETVKKLQETETERAKREAAELVARTAAGRESDVKAIFEHVKTDVKTYPFLSRNADWVAEAYDKASDAYPDIKKDLGRELNGDEKRTLILAALAEKEAEHGKRAALYGAPSVALERPVGATPPRPSARPTTFDASMRGGTGAAVTKSKTKLTFADVKKARRASN